MFFSNCSNLNKIVFDAYKRRMVFGTTKQIQNLNARLLIKKYLSE